MPVVFIGHGSPMNAIENNIYTESWKYIGQSIPRPKAIVLFSAHWITEWHTAVSVASELDMIYDMYWFPPELYDVAYPAKGSPELAHKIITLLKKEDFPILSEDNRGIDHGEWSVLTHMFPFADIPVVSVSLDYQMTTEWLMSVWQDLAPLREEWILFIWSGNIVHNLSAMNWLDNTPYPWAYEFDDRVASLIQERKYIEITWYESWGDMSRLSHPTIDHFLPLLPLLGMLEEEDIPDFFTPDIVMGSLSMRSVVWE